MHQAKLPWRWVSSCPRRGKDRSQLGFSLILSLHAMFVATELPSATREGRCSCVVCLQGDMK
jgi:hypothetical protein